MPWHNVLNLVGHTNGRLKVIAPLPRNDKGEYMWHCRCYCGNFCEYSTPKIRHTKWPAQSCGHCYLDKRFKKEYHTWENMKDRCYNKNRARYPNYGGRGITVCQRWRHDFLYFLEDMGLCPTPWHTIERKDVDGNYEPSNCVWMLDAFQNFNTTRSIKYKESHGQG